MNDNQVLEQLAETDAYAPGTLMPASAWSRDTALSEIERRMGMEPRESTKQPTVTSNAQQLEETKAASVAGQASATQQKKTTPGRLLVGAAAVLVLILGLGTWAVIGGDRDAAVEPEVAVVQSAYEALNDGDIDGYFALLTEEAAVRERREFQQVLVNMNQQSELAEPCRLIEPTPAGEARVSCTATFSNDFHGPGGLTATLTESFVVTDAGKISLRLATGGNFDPNSDFNADYWEWLMVAHPDVHADIAPFEAGQLPGAGELRGEPDDMLVALEYVDEFVAQSDEYPINP